MMVGITPGRSPSCFRLVSGSCLSRWQTAAPRKSQICSAARPSWDPSGSLPWLLGGSEDPWLSVPVFRRVWFYRHCLYRKYSCSPANCHVAQRCPPLKADVRSLCHFAELPGLDIVHEAANLIFPIPRSGRTFTSRTDYPWVIPLRISHKSF